MKNELSNRKVDPITNKAMKFQILPMKVHFSEGRGYGVACGPRGQLHLRDRRQRPQRVGQHRVATNVGSERSSHQDQQQAEQPQVSATRGAATTAARGAATVSRTTTIVSSERRSHQHRQREEKPPASAFERIHNLREEQPPGSAASGAATSVSNERSSDDRSERNSHSEQNSDQRQQREEEPPASTMRGEATSVSSEEGGVSEFSTRLKTDILPCKTFPATQNILHGKKHKGFLIRAGANVNISLDLKARRPEVVSGIKECLSNCLSETFLDKSVPGVGSKIRGKVRDIYNAGDYLILVTTDRQSAFDRILASVPFKGQVLNQTSLWWFNETKEIAPNAVVSAPDPNVTIAKKCTVFPVEFV
ncbi:hypothetical protein KI387_030541, partial [Taxus chinensis]